MYGDDFITDFIYRVICVFYLRNKESSLSTMRWLLQLWLDRSIRMISFWQGNDILSNIRQDEYEEVIQMLENAILATDLALYFKYAFIFGVICLKSTPLFEFLFLSAKFFFVSWKYWPCRVQIIGELEVFVVLFTLYSALFGFCEHIESNILQLLEFF